ncbi:MAG: 2-hydroxyacid dehydrogenase [Bdellovibrionaceae bacterium]|nr:2-hydroxyacid dehydrogenase [Pseudobdellovibrionaceae bacterium]
MRVLFFDTHRFEQEFFLGANARFGHELEFLEARLTEQTVVLAQGAPCVCVFVNDRVNESVLRALADGGTRIVALRSAGFNHVDLKAAAKVGIKVVRVPEYSPFAVAEHATALILSLDRKIHRAFFRVREGNFSLDGLIGFDLHGRTVGLIGTGKIGRVMAKIMNGFGCRLLASDPEPDSRLIQELGLSYVDLDVLFKESDIISLHLPLTPGTRHLINAEAITKMKPGVMLINTGRGALIDTRALIGGLKSGHIGSAGLDVYEEEEGIFFEDLSGQVLQDDVLARLLTFPNVILTAHQGFLTREALTNIAETTLANITALEQGADSPNEVRPDTHVMSADTRRATKG